MAFFDLFRKSRPRCAPTTSRPRVRLGLEALENRWAPSGVDVLPSDSAEEPPPADDSYLYKTDETTQDTSTDSGSDTGGGYDVDIGTDVGEGTSWDLYP